MPDKPRVDPYDFVPLVDKPRRETPVGHERYQDSRHSGRLTCRLTAKTPLFIYDRRFVRRNHLGHETVNFPVFNGDAVIQGSSLKGVIRSLIEAIEPCCIAVPATFRKSYRGSGITKGRELPVRLPPGFDRCDEGIDAGKGRCRPKILCPACRMFGSLDPMGKWAYAGKVSLGDAHSRRGEYTLLPHVTLDVLSTPKPEARAKAYTRDDGKTIRGRKFYRHRYPPDILERLRDNRTGHPKQDHQNKTVQPVQEEDSKFSFEVDYNDLSNSELRLLLYGLELEEGLWHKLGLGKPIGLGSAKIEITAWTQIDRQARYRSLGAGIQPSLGGEQLRAELSKWLQPYRERQTENLKKLRDILMPNQEVDVRYPAPRSSV